MARMWKRSTADAMPVVERYSKTLIKAECTALSGSFRPRIPRSQRSQLCELLRIVCVRKNTVAQRSDPTSQYSTVSSSERPQFRVRVDERVRLDFEGRATWLPRQQMTSPDRTSATPKPFWRECLFFELTKSVYSFCSGPRR